MNSNDKVGLIERVNHASEDQAKRALNSMILKCNVQQDTIARAIKDAIERHLPTPMIVYQQPESEDDDEAALTSSRKRSKKEKKVQDGSSQDEDDAPSAASKKRQSTRRGDINADPHIGNLILEKKKTKFKGKKKRSSDHDQEQNSRDASKTNKSKYASGPRAETKQRTGVDSKGTASNQKGPPVIDLVTSSDDETIDTEQPRNEILDDKSSADNSSDNESSGDYSSDSDSSDSDSSDSDSSDDEDSEEEGSEEEVQGDTLVDGVGPSQDGSSKKANQANPRSGNNNPVAARSVTVSMAKASAQSGGIEMTPFDLSKKRKAPDLSLEDAHNDTAAQRATSTQANKRAKRDRPQESHNSLVDRSCQNCGVLFPSARQLLRHRPHCKSAIATPTADTFADYNPTYEAGGLPQLPVHLNRGGQTAQALSAPRRDFDTLPTGESMETNHSHFSPSHCEPKAKARSSNLSFGNASSLGPDSDPYLAPRRQPESHDMEKLQSLMENVYKCRRCGLYYEPSHNEAGDCQRGHSGRCRKRPGNYSPQSGFRIGQRFENCYIWTCCGQQGKNAPACNKRTAVKHVSQGRARMSKYERSPSLRQYMQRFF